ncbi:hypothetical protein BI344_04315 [Chromobacterium sphagni]|uniref:Lipoprotein n=1 Tax=Chromobacterium sphagni TaxID=1903179 RepID=A0ABX3CIH9_9NEIS|nr:hypothetical protein BI344_04315 [Chromobacterium sphagni]
MLPLLLGLLAVCHHADAETIKTRYGTVSDETRTELRLNKKAIYADNGNMIYLQGSYPLKDKDVALVSSNCGGSGCVRQSFALIAIGKGGVARKYKLGDFGTDVEAKARLEGQQLRVEFSPEAGMQTTILFDGDKTRKTEQRVQSKAAVALADCQSVYEIADACVDAGQQGSDCNGKMSDDFAGGDARALADLQGSYKETAFNQVCQSFCQAKRKTIAFRAFSKRVCVLK